MACSSRTCSKYSQPVTRLTARSSPAVRQIVVNCGFQRIFQFYESTTIQRDLLWRNKLVQIYISGVILLALGIAMWKFVFRYSPWYEILSDPVLVSIFTELSIVVLPMILGAVFVYGFHPLLGRWQKWSDLMRMQDRLLGELSIDSAPQIVLINWPSDDVRTAGKTL